MIKKTEVYKKEILYGIDEILKYTKDMDMPAFIKDTKTYNATMMCLELIGEAASKLPESVKS